MGYQYENLSEDTFEKLVVQISKIYFGSGVKPFAKGPDGGRDAFFNGKADNYPSKSEPWNGKIVIQAKHTDYSTASFSDKKFSSDTKTSIISKEINSINNLIENNNLDYYILFSNRSLAAQMEKKISELISSKTNLLQNRIAIIGKEEMDSVLESYPELKNIFKELLPITPLSFSAEEMAKIVFGIKDVLTENIKSNTLLPSKRTKFDRKNEINNLSIPYARKIKKQALPFHSIFTTFLQNPINEEVSKAYYDTIFELQSLIITYREEFDKFEKIIDSICHHLYSKNSFLSTNKRTTRIIVELMYYNCDIGEREDD